MNPSKSSVYKQKNQREGCEHCSEWETCGYIAAATYLPWKYQLLRTVPSGELSKGVIPLGSAVFLKLVPG